MAGVRIHPLNQLTARSLSSDESILVVSEDASAEDAALVREAIGAGAVDADALITAAESMTTEQEGEMRDALAIGDALVVPAGLVADAKLFDSAGITSGAATLTTATGSFEVADVGKFIRVRGAGVAGADLVTTILARASATSITLAANASTTVVSAQGVYGTDNTSAIQTAVTAAYNSGSQKTVYIPAGRYLCNILSYSGVKILGARGLIGQSAFTRINYASAVAFTILTPAISTEPVIRFETATGGGNASIEEICFIAGDGTVEADRIGTAIEVGEPLNTVNGAVAAGLEIKRCELNGFYYGATFSRMWGSIISMTTVNYCTVGFFSGELTSGGLPSNTGPADGMVFVTCTSNHVKHVYQILGSKQTAIISGDYNNMEKFLIADAAQVQITGVNIETCTEIIFHLIEGSGQSRVTCDHISSIGTIGIGCRDERDSEDSFNLLSNYGFVFKFQTASATQYPINLPPSAIIERYTDTTFATLRSTEFWDVFSRRSIEGIDLLKAYDPMYKTNASPYGSLGWILTNIAGTTAVTGQSNAISLYQDAASESARFMPETVGFSFATNWRMVWRFQCAGGHATTVFRLGLYSQDGPATLIPTNGIGLRADTVTEGDTTLKLEVIVAGVKQTAVDTGIALTGLNTRRDLILEKRGAAVYLTIKETTGTFVANQIVYTGTMPSSAVAAGPGAFLSGSAAQLYYLSRMSLEQLP